MGIPGDFLRHLGQLAEGRHDRPAKDTHSAPAFRWIPIRSLAQRHRGRILEHLLQLGERDRYLRFGYMASDEQVRRYVERIDFARDEVFGIFNRRLALVAVAHLAYLPPDAKGNRSAEFGVSVHARARGRGYGARLFDHAVLHARNRNVDTLIVHALSENAAMLKIARNAGATVHREGGDAEAVLKLPPDDMASHMGAMVEDQAAEIDYRLKVQARRMDEWLQAVSEVRDQLARVGRPGES
jgi:RimJ/RimL family protein N-acetyltransferase